ncbi:MAG TPA: hypothetical protein VGS12_17675 [Caulobacteraceae bacterium]|nr:hypothetical protein [Caulobacteraceae bacterium]
MIAYRLPNGQIAVWWRGGTYVGPLATGDARLEEPDIPSEWAALLRAADRGEDLKSRGIHVRPDKTGPRFSGESGAALPAAAELYRKVIDARAAACAALRGEVDEPELSPRMHNWEVARIHLAQALEVEAAGAASRRAALGRGSAAAAGRRTRAKEDRYRSVCRIVDKWDPEKQGEPTRAAIREAFNQQAQIMGISNITDPGIVGAAIRWALERKEGRRPITQERLDQLGIRTPSDK